ncbi:hypothetical protein PR048_019857 [Dryococelus australis]|uniref:Uncharacterized protein n=1 Tax=Dryococelus australis TaxID=614101 RepID=A0ABQ9H4P1_9NEOP|nr:hypothetical protein PR048_019857 [Dryococelus australis]
MSVSPSPPRSPLPILYGPPVWTYCAKTYMEQLQRVQNKWLKIATHVPRYIPTRELHEQLQQPKLFEVIQEIVEKSYATAHE